MPAPNTEEVLFGVTRSVTGRVWRVRPTAPRMAEAIAQGLGVPEIVGRVLAGRGVSVDDAPSYLAPSLRAFLPDPNEVTDMTVAAERVADAVMSGAQVGVFGDYDVDGATSTALLKRFFDAVGGKLRIYIPDRMTEGYGPNTPALLQLGQEGCSLILTVDCGISAFEPLAAARAAGIDMIVVDHHMAEPRLPEAVAVVNPNRLDDQSGLGHLAAVGVAFLLVVAVNRVLRQRGWYTPQRQEPDLLGWLDIVALGTVCDVVPLTGLNRALVTQGIKVMAQRRNEGLAALADVARVDETPGVYHLGFVMGPRVNAGGRVGRADLGARLLTTSDPVEARSLAEELDRYNSERQAIEAAVLEDAMTMVERRFGVGDEATLPSLVFAAGEGWHPGVIGIVASRLKERFGRPAFVIAIDGDVGKGSARSISGVDLGAAVTAARQAGLLVNGGGHKMAAGLTVERSRIGELETFFADRLKGPVSDAREGMALLLDGALAAGAVTTDLVEILDQAGPYGAGNAQPRFAFQRLRVQYADLVGTNHVRCTFEGADGRRIKGVAFRAADNPLGELLLSRNGGAVHVAGTLRLNRWNGRESAELHVEDAAPA